MNEQVSKLMENWNERQGDLKKFAALDLDFSYKFSGKQLEEKMPQIIDALAFWKFVDGVGWWARIPFLAYFVANSNPLIRIVAMAESLPTGVWRKILWKHNIDFMSFESFLRRLEEKQIEAIKQNYEDLFVAGEVPRIFSRLERFFRGITVEKLLEEGFNSEKRYSRKAAMSFNLLNLDFGFNAYPKGVKDDTKVEEISPLKFLSVKNHADDFVVNKEDGKYWWLYRKARSNYVWRPNREVKIKTHICPGFWYTLLVHSVFWIASPLYSAAFVGIISRGLSNMNWWVAGPIGIVGLITPLWLLLAGIKLSFKIVVKAGAALINSALTEQMAESFDRWSRRNKDAIGNCLTGSLLAVVLILFSVIIFLALHQDIGTVGAIATIAMILTYLGYGVLHSKYEFTTFKYFPLYLKMPIMFVVFCLVYKFLLLYQAMIISGIFAFVFFLEWLVVLAVNAIKTAFLFLMSVIISFGVQKFAVMTAIVGIPVAIIAMLHYLPEEKQKKFYDILGNGLWYGCGAYFFSAILALGYFLVVYIGILGLFFMSAGIALYGVGIWYLFFYSSPYVKDSRWITQYTSGNIDFRELLENKWLLSLGRYEAKEKLHSLYLILMPILDWEKKYYDTAIRYMAPFISPNVIQKLENHKQALIKIKKIHLRLMVIKVLVSQDVDFESAIMIARKEIAAQNEQKMLKVKKTKELKEWIERWLKEIGKVLYVVFFIPIQFFKLIAAILRGVWFTIKKLWEYTLTLRRLWELFNERCPYITESKVLRFK